MFNPLDFVTQKDIEELGLTAEDLRTAYQPSRGGVYHLRGGEGRGKTLLGSHFYRNWVNKGIVKPERSYGNLTFKGKYGKGFTTLKGQAFHEFLWKLTHDETMRDLFIFIDEIDSEFPARSFSQKEQTEIATRMWHTNKLGNRVIMTSHKGKSADLIFHLASHFVILPEKPSFKTNSLDFTFIDDLDFWHDDFTAHDIIKTMLIYNRCELTEDMNFERAKPRPNKDQTIDDDLPEAIDAEAEMAYLA